LKKQVVSQFFCFIFINMLYAQTDTAKGDPIEFEFKLGLNSNFIIDNSDFKSANTGFGIFFEPFITDNISVVLSYNSFRIKTRESGYIKTNSEEISTRDLFLMLRYRFVSDKLSLYPEIGAGDWGSTAGYLTAGLGIDLNIINGLILSTSLDYLIAGHRYLDLAGGNGWTSSMYKINLNLSWLFSKE